MHWNDADFIILEAENASLKAKLEIAEAENNKKEALITVLELKLIDLEINFECTEWQIKYYKMKIRKLITESKDNEI